MKPPAFLYHAPDGLQAALELISGLEEAKVLAGGQSLMPMLNMRYVQPKHVVDLNRIQELSFVSEGDGRLSIGAMTRHREIEFSPTIRRHLPILHEAILQVGHRQTRNRGTLGGSLAHLDPAAELPLVAATLGATVQVRNLRASRAIQMEAFPLAYMTPAIEPDELITSVEFPVWPARHGYAFLEFARRLGDFAIVAAAVLMTTDEKGRVARCSIYVGGIGPAPIRCDEAEKLLIGEQGSDKLFAAAAETCRTFDAMNDAFAPSWYRQHLATVLIRRAIEVAFRRVTQDARGGRA